MQLNLVSRGICDRKFNCSIIIIETICWLGDRSPPKCLNLRIKFRIRNNELTETCLPVRQLSLQIQSLQIYNDSLRLTSIDGRYVVACIRSSGKQSTPKHSVTKYVRYNNRVDQLYSEYYMIDKGEYSYFKKSRRLLTNQSPALWKYYSVDR